MQKKIRNKTKKLQKVEELEMKVKKKEIVPNEEQKEKIASKDSIIAEINEVKSYLDVYEKSRKEDVQKQKEISKAHANELRNAKAGAVRTVANMIAIISLKDKAQNIPEELEEGVKHFADCLHDLQGRDAKEFRWRQQRDCFNKCWLKLV